MKTAYIFRIDIDKFYYESPGRLGIHFISSAVDITFLDNVVIDKKLRISVKQKIGSHSVSKPVMWVTLLSGEPMANQFLEESLNYTRKILNNLWVLINVGISIPYSNIYCLPNIPETTDIKFTEILLEKNGSFKALRIIDKNRCTIHEGEKEYQATDRSVKADLVFAIGSENQRTQCQFLHTTIPSQNISVDASNLRIPTNPDLSTFFNSLDLDNDFESVLFDLYNRAITSQDAVASFLVMYQIVELFINKAERTHLTKEQLAKIKEKFDDLEEIPEQYKGRVLQSLQTIPMESSLSLLKSGLESVLGECRMKRLNFSKLSKWRKFRGNIAHPNGSIEISNRDFVQANHSLSSFIQSIMKEYIDYKYCESHASS
jgi:hypothetical protein